MTVRWERAGRGIHLKLPEPYNPIHANSARGKELWWRHFAEQYPTEYRRIFPGRPYDRTGT